MLRTGELLDPLKGLCHGASPVGSRLAAAVSYRAAWSLPGPDFHWLVSVNLRATRFADPTSFRGCLAIWARRNRVQLQAKPLPGKRVDRPPLHLEEQVRALALLVITAIPCCISPTAGGRHPPGSRASRPLG